MSNIAGDDPTTDVLEVNNAAAAAAPLRQAAQDTAQIPVIPAPVVHEPVVHDAPVSLPAGATGILTIDLAAIVANWRKLQKKVIPAECAAVVKADAYGCGLAPVTRALAKAGCRTFFVATHEEACAARDAAPDAALYVLDGFLGKGETLAACDARPVISDFHELAEWEAFRQVSGWRGEAALHIDTGMNRLGLTIADCAMLLTRFNAGDHGLSLVMSHLACAESISHAMNQRQLGIFREMAGRFSGLTASLANSSGIYLGSAFGFDLVRPGAALYGVNPTPESDNPMLPVIDLKARILQLRQIDRGDTVGYGATWTARRQTRLAIISAGYADGYFRSGGSSDGSRGADVVIAGKRCPVVGRISMDLTAVDITELGPDSVKRGDLATLIGEGITVDSLAHHFGTIGYEVLTSLGRRFARVYKGGEA